MLLISLGGVIPLDWSGIAGAALMVRNIWPAPGHPGFWYTSHFWSLAAEEHFYLFMPGFLALFRRRRLAIFASLTIALEVWRRFVMATPALQSKPSWWLAQRTDMVLGGILLGSVFAIALTNADEKSAQSKEERDSAVACVAQPEVR